MNRLRLFAGEDSLTAACANGELVRSRVQVFLKSGVWEEVVRGMTDLTVKYDPLAMSRAGAEEQFRRLWQAPNSSNFGLAEPLVLSAGFAADDAPDRQMVADALGVDAPDLPDWLAKRRYRVTMMGFQPGFAYLEDSVSASLPTLPRLASPRQRVTAGSIGFLGSRACIYALDGPGGWPIIGRVGERLFRPDNPQAFLLEPGQLVQFRA